MAVPALTRVLVVEDDPDIQAVVTFALGQVGGLQVEACASGPEAIARAVDFRPEIVLLDAMLPGMDGTATLRALRGLPETASTPVVFMTARAQPHELEAYRRAGACDVLVKPFDARRLPSLLGAIWRRIHGEPD
jgi:CheY-like chemotaxis protein